MGGDQDDGDHGPVRGDGTVPRAGELGSKEGFGRVHPLIVVQSARAEEAS